ncbi:MotE family protein [Ornithinibacillus halotolerans]|uniref:Magnesium transporter MgtE intracellular domain-containing protein n=1 Tax=Ornithinibacillus halotolerans TaxID=1274357 RepID=A0A916RNR5_9BACI|nr:hypothetical protein [Ornithinibacillus halotolerans]GGA63088.1 hypothetical protein GCM10008025_03760 [Ornithinibacillus halotolerans]
MAKERIADEKEKMNPFLWFLFAIVIPIIIAATLTVIVFAIAGVNVMDWAKNTGNNIPVLSSLITTTEEEAAMEKKEDIQTTLDAKDTEIKKLQDEKVNLEGTIEKLETEIVKLESELESVISSKMDSEQSIKQITSSLSEMESEQAAGILEQLDVDVAFAIIKEMSTENRGLILGNMNPSAAAEITKLFINVE